MGTTSGMVSRILRRASCERRGAEARKLEALAAVQKLGEDPITAVQIIEQGGIQPLLRCYNAAHPLVRIEAAKALATLARQLKGVTNDALGSLFGDGLDCVFTWPEVTEVCPGMAGIHIKSC